MESKKVSTAAYTPFKTFLNILDHLKAHGVPNIIDRSMFPNYSGTLQGQIIGALLFLDLIDDNGIPNETLKELVYADNEKRRPMLKPILQKHYNNLFEAGLTRVTPSQFEQLFSTENYGVSGDTRKKARAFLFFALDYAGVPYSKLLKQRTRSPRKKTVTNSDAPKTENGADAATLPDNAQKSDDTVYGTAIKSIELVESEKTVWIGTDANMFEIKRGKDLDFVLALIELFDKYENSNNAETPAEETFVAETE